MSDLPPTDAGAGPNALQAQAADASAAVADLAATGAAAAASIDAVFAKAGASLSGALAKAASDGKASLGELAAAAIQAADAFAGSSVGGSATSGLAGALGSALSGVFAGARADGGPVGAGGAYLVGERGPELFRPSTAGDVSPVGGGGTVVNLTVQGGGAPSILRSEAQIAAALARAVRMGGRLMVAAFTETRLPVRLGFGSSGGVERRTDITQLASGYETRITPWANGRRRYLIGQAIRTLDDAVALVAFFEARRGRLQGFRFRDFADFKSCAPSGTPGPLDQPIARLDGGLFQLGKTYGDGDDAYLRPIAKPVSGSVRVAVDEVELAGSAFAVDPATGLVTFTSPPAPEANLTAGFLFDTPMRFDANRIDVALEGFDAGRVVAVPLIEVRV